MISLRPDAVPTGRPFAAIEQTADDLAVMERMLRRLRRHVATVAAQGSARRRDDRVRDPDDGGQHRIVIPNVARATRSRDLAAVGFFGQARMDVDHAPIVDLESALLEDMVGDGSPLVYHNVYWPGVGWGNVVLFADGITKDTWGRGDARHAAAIALAPLHYHSIRLHNGVVPGGLPGTEGIRLLRTKYLDFSEDPPWRAVRTIG